MSTDKIGDEQSASQVTDANGERSDSQYDTPMRHHQRHPSTPRHVKETLHAVSEWSNSQDDGTAIHKINQYVISDEIGRGSFGSVHLATDQYGNEYAVKEFSKSRLRKRAQSSVLRRPHGAGPGRSWFSPQNSRYGAGSSSGSSGQSENSLYLIKEEIAIMKKLNHPNLVGLLEVLDDPEEDSLYMVLEMCKKGVIMKVGMHQVADPYDSESCRCWFRDLILGIEYLHAQGVAHRDIKPDNLLLTSDDELKIVDFGVSEMFEKSSDFLTTKSAGSPAFLPPELCIMKPGHVSGKAADIWSMGVTLYCLYFGRVPFEQSNILELYQSISNEKIVLPEDTEANFKDLMHEILEKDPEKRIKMPELREHPWVTKNSTDPLMSAEENITTIVEPPTEEEVNRAITKSMGNVLAVVRAARQFKRLLSRNQTGASIEGILGPASRIVQPPLQMDEHTISSKSGKVLTTALPPRLTARSPSLPAFASQQVREKESAALVETPDAMSPVSSPIARPPLRHTSSSQSARERSDLKLHQRVNTPHSGRGQAHDPLTDVIFLGVGADGVGSKEHPPTETVAISESPSAAEDTNIYELAYQAEIERIKRDQGRHATVYLTRRIDTMWEALRAQHGPGAGGLVDQAAELGREFLARDHHQMMKDGIESGKELAHDVGREVRRELSNSGMAHKSATVSGGDSSRLESLAARAKDMVHEAQEARRAKKG